MKKVFVSSIVVLTALAAVPAFAETPGGDVNKVFTKYRAALPESQDLGVYRLDWVASLDAAKEKAAREKRPILLIVVTNSYGNLHSGHC